MAQIVTVRNVKTIEYTALVDLMHDIYTKEIPDVDIGNPLDPMELEKLMIFFSNQYAYVIELWAIMAHEVRLLKRIKVNKDAIDEAMGARDYLEKVASACKLKYYSSSALLKAVRDEN